jgi:hypothetical protein
MDKQTQKTNSKTKKGVHLSGVEIITVEKSIMTNSCKIWSLYIAGRSKKEKFEIVANKERQ